MHNGNNDRPKNSFEYVMSELHCSFCKKSGEHAKLIASGGGEPRAYICDACVALCCHILDDDADTSLFYSYSHKDEKLRLKLDEHLAVLKREGIIKGWSDRQISPGTEWQSEIDAKLKSADLILLLVSASFVASEYCYGRELTEALKRHKNGECRVIPVILRPVDWHKTPFASLQALPKDGKPITMWSNREAALLDVVRGIRQAATELRSNALLHRSSQ